MKKLLSLLLTLSFTFSILASPATAKNQININHVILGDSIAAGVGATDNFGYTQMFNQHLDHVFGDVTKYDYSTPGLTVASLGAMLSNPSYVADPNPEGIPPIGLVLPSADIITVSIGGNELLQPILGLIEDPTYPDNLPLDPNDIPAQLIILLGGNPEIIETNATLALTGVFTALKTIAPDAVIYISNVYNPFKPDDLLYPIVDEYIVAINNAIALAIINTNTVTPDPDMIFLVDIYDSFDAYANPIKPIVHALPANLYIIPIVDPMPPYLHPTDRGYILMFHEYKKLLTIKELSDLIE